MKVPNVPTNGAKSGQVDPKSDATLLANSIGMLSSPIPLTPELIKTLPKGTAVPKAIVVPIRLLEVVLIAELKVLIPGLNKKMLITAVKVNTAPGE